MLLYGAKVVGALTAVRSAAMLADDRPHRLTTRRPGKQTHLNPRSRYANRFDNYQRRPYFVGCKPAYVPI